MSGINYSEKIPNNVNLSDDRTLQRALEQWQPNFINWWDEMGPEGSTDMDVYLRTAVSVDPQGWAQFGHVKMRDYRWGIFLNPGQLYAFNFLKLSNCKILPATKTSTLSFGKLAAPLAK